VVTFPPVPRGLKDLIELGRWLGQLQVWAKALAIELAAALGPEVHVMTAAGAISPAWDVVEYNGPGGESITLPSAARIPGRSRPLRFINNGAAAVTLVAQSGETVADAASMSINTASLTDLSSNGARGWRCVGGIFRATARRLSSVLDVTGNITARALLTFPGSSTGSPVTVQLLGDLRQMVFGTVNAVIVGNRVNGGGLSIGSTDADLIGFHGVTPIARPVLATGAGRTVDDVITALQNRGLVKQS
jgi:hypothetical protein